MTQLPINNHQDDREATIAFLADELSASGIYPPTARLVLLAEAFYAVGVRDINNITGNITVTSTYETVFSAGENPFLSNNFRTPEVINAVFDVFQDREPNEIHDTFNSCDSFSQLAETLCNRFDVTHWSATIGDFTVTTTFRVTVVLA